MVALWCYTGNGVWGVAAAALWAGVLVSSTTSRRASQNPVREEAVPLALATEFNLLLVEKGGRQAFLLELNDDEFKDYTRRQVLEEIKRRWPALRATRESVNRVLIHKEGLQLPEGGAMSNEFLARVLGFNCEYPGHVREGTTTVTFYVTRHGQTEPFITYVCFDKDMPEQDENIAQNLKKFSGVAASWEASVSVETEANGFMDTLVHNLVHSDQLESKTWIENNEKEQIKLIL